MARMERTLEEWIEALKGGQEYVLSIFVNRPELILDSLKESKEGYNSGLRKLISGMIEGLNSEKVINELTGDPEEYEKNYDKIMNLPYVEYIKKAFVKMLTLEKDVELINREHVNGLSSLIESKYTHPKIKEAAEACREIINKHYSENPKKTERRPV